MSQSQESPSRMDSPSPEAVNRPSTPINPPTPPRTPVSNRRHRQRQAKTTPIKPKYGDIPGIEVGDLFSNRSALHVAGVHLPSRAGIHGRQDSGAYSIVLSGRYEDDADGGEEMYVGHGGKNENEEEQQTDQHWTPANKSLRVSCDLKSPVRVIRGAHARTKWAPREGYRYDGLYQVDEVSEKIGKGGHKVCVFKLKRLPGQRRLGEVSTNPMRISPEQNSAERRANSTDHTPRRKRRRRRQSSELPEFVQGSSTSTGPQRIRHRSPEYESDFDAEWQSPSKRIKRKHAKKNDATNQNRSSSPEIIDLSGVDLNSRRDIRYYTSPPWSRSPSPSVRDRSMYLDRRDRPVSAADGNLRSSSTSVSRRVRKHVNLTQTFRRRMGDAVHVSVLKDEYDEDSDEEMSDKEQSGRGSVTSGSIQVKGPFIRENRDDSDDSDIEISSITYFERDSSIEVEGPFPISGPRNYQEVTVKTERDTTKQEKEEPTEQLYDNFYGLESVAEAVRDYSDELEEDELDE